MKRVLNPELDRQILQHIGDLYNIFTKREGIHLSTLVYCLTRSFLDQVQAIDPTDQEVMLFALGYGLQDVLTPTGAETPTYEKNGIIYRPDFTIPVQDKIVELKTTRASSGKEDYPETWLEYIKGGCYILDTQTYELSVLYILGNYHPPFPQIRSETIHFSKQELDENWNYLLSRKKVYEEAMTNKVPPTPFQYCKQFECKYCRYHMVCQSIQMIGGGA